MFVFDEIQCDFIHIVAQKFKQLWRNDDALEHDSSGTNFRKEYQVGLALSGADLIFEDFDFFFKEEILFLEIFVFFSLFSIIKMCELFLQFLQVVCNIVVLHITIRAESLQIVFSWDVIKKYTEGVHSHLVSLELSKYSPSLWPPWKSFCSKIWRSARTRYSKDLWGRFSLWTPASN